MIGFSVRWAVPFIFLVVATSALQKLFPGPVPGWLLHLSGLYFLFAYAFSVYWWNLYYYENPAHRLRVLLDGLCGLHTQDRGLGQ